jgi:predicted nuclease of predicted toxin-antitoxin system
MGKIRIYTNESVDDAIAEALKRWGVDASSVRNTGNLGLTDEEQLVYAGKEKAAVFTHDPDFLRIAPRWMDEGKTHHGIIYCHQKSYPIGECVRRLRMLTSVLTLEDMVNHIEFL